MIITQFANPVVGALALTGLMAAAVSTAAAMILMCATAIIVDIRRQFLNAVQTEADDRRTTVHLRITIIVIGILVVLVATRPFALLSVLLMYLFGAFGAMFFGTVILGILWKRMNRAGAYAGIITGIVAYGIGVTLIPQLPPFLVGTIPSIIATVIAVHMTPPPPLEAYESYFEVKISDSTREAIKKIQKDIDTSKK
jgi:sodium/pantothenate symporter